MGFYYGGQAVVEGVMMRGRKSAVIAVRRPDGEVITTSEALPAIYSGWLRKTPLVRGIIALVESLVLGIKTIVYSANMSLEDEEEQISSWVVFVMLALSVALAALLFAVTPLLLTRLLTAIAKSSLLFNLVEGFIRLAIFIAYLKLVSFMPDIKRAFAYHGAEHKTVNAYEHGAPLELESVRKYSTAHIRCGTSFMFIVLVIAVLVFSFIGMPSLWLMLLLRLTLIPVIAAIAYEFIFFAARHCENPFIKLLLKPGLMLQALTTREPDDSQLQVAIAALRKAVEIDEADTVP